MSTPTAVSPDEGVSVSRAGSVSRLRLRMFITLVRREFWEHRSLWMTPLAVAGLLLICALPTHGAFQINVDDDVQSLDPQHKAILFALAQWGLSVPHYLVMIIVLNFYLLDCLYAERKDRSILFWKSLPVSDGATVASKLFVGLIVVPVATFAVALVTNLLFTAIWNLRAVFGHSPDLVLWDTVALLKVETLMLLGLIVSILWYAPLVASLLLASAWARRNVLLWVTLVPLVAVIVEKIAFGTRYVSGLIAYRTFGIWESLHVEAAVLDSMTRVGQSEVVSLPRLLEHINIGPAFTNIDLWLGLVVTGAFAFAAARLRRYRDDS
jgi:ABC-2 type transport system permease protein